MSPFGHSSTLILQISVIGNVVGIIPPSLYALVQFDWYQLPLIGLGAFTALQLFVSNFVSPMLQGNRMVLSSLAVIVWITFWGWVWGIPGALLAAPLTAWIVILAKRFSSTKWIATLLSP